MNKLLKQLQSSLPKYTTILPSTKLKVKFRPFTVKEEKTLLVSHTTSLYEEMLYTISDVIDSCFELKNPSKEIPFFDLEYLFLKLRSKSINEIIDLTFVCPDTKEKITKEINLEDIEPIYNDKHTQEIILDGDIKIKMRYPTLEDIVNNENLDYYNLLITCIESIETKDELIQSKDYSKQNMEELVNNLTRSQFNKIIEFFKTMPRVETTIKYQTKDGTEREIKLKGIRDFFQSASATQI